MIMQTSWGDIGYFCITEKPKREINEIGEYLMIRYPVISSHGRSVTAIFV